MFNYLVESTGVRRGARTTRYFVGTAVVWGIALVAIVVAGIMAFDARVNADFESSAMLAPVVPPPPPPPPAPGHRSAAEQPSAPVRARVFESQREAPVICVPPRPQPPSSTTGIGVPGAHTAGDPGGEIGGAVESFGSGPIQDNQPRTPSDALSIPPPPPAPVERVVAPARPISKGPIAGTARKRVQPPYPIPAKSAGVQGAVVVEVTVSESGKVLSARAINGHPLLREAAVSAARNWEFSPTLLGDVPVKVIGTITFNFTLN